MTQNILGSSGEKRSAVFLIKFSPSAEISIFPVHDIHSLQFSGFLNFCSEKERGKEREREKERERKDREREREIEKSTRTK